MSCDSFNPDRHSTSYPVGIAREAHGRPQFSFSSIAAILHNARQLPFSQEHNTLIDRADNGINWYGRQLINLRGEDTEALSIVSDGKTLYEIRRTFGGLSEPLMRRIVDVTV